MPFPKLHRSRLCWGALLGIAGPVAAQVPPVFPGEEMVVTAARVPQKLADALRSVTVITAADIARGGQSTLAEVLQQLGGLEHVSSGGPGSSSAVFIRGANSAHTLVLVDGIRLQSATTGTTAFENIPLAQIERIEILPGPASSLYGSDAIGGVIQVFTKGARGPLTPEASLGAGSWGTAAARASVGGTAGGTDYSLSAGYNRTSGFSATRPTVSFGRYHPDDDGYRNASVTGRVEHRFAPGHAAGASIFFSDGETKFDNGPDTDNRTRQKLATVSAFSRNAITAGWESLVRLGHTRDDSRSTGDDEPGFFRTDADQLTWQNTVALGPVSVVAGAEYLRQKIDTSTPYDVARRSVTSVFAGATGESGDHGVQASVRRDDNSQYGQPGTGSVAYGYRVNANVRLRASYGTAFHAPSFNDLYFPGFGNATLKPERSINREAGVDLQWLGHRLTATYFDNRIRDLIDFTFNETTFEFKPENVARARVRGTEVSFAARMGATDLRAKFTVQDPESQPSGFQLQRRAKRHGSASAYRTFGAWRVGAELVASGARFDSANESPSSRMGGYAIANLVVGYSISREWSLDLRWNNVADRDYERVKGFNTPGSNALLTLRWTPGR